jgi:hypothetical protein
MGLLPVLTSLDHLVGAGEQSDALVARPGYCPN